MKQKIRSIFALLVIAIGFVGTAAVPAYGVQEADVITDNQIKVIKARCTELKATLQQLHDSDLLLRYNRGGLYRTISDQLMSPLNQRIASNQLDGSDLVKVTANYNTTYQQFFNAYKSYEDSLSTVLSTDCNNQPSTFYSQLLDARQKRLALHESSTKLVTLAKSYKTSFDTFKQATLKSLESQ